MEVCVVMALIALLATNALGQTKWTKYEGNPVLDLGAPGEWDDSNIGGLPSVLFEDCTYKMYYSGSDGSNVRIGYATSPDGIVWTKYAGNPVLDLGVPGEWDDYHVFYPFVLFEDGTYKMWYSGSDGSNYRIGYATSPDGIVWTKYAGNPLDLDTPGEWDDYSVSAPSVLFEDGLYKMWYSGFDGSNWRIGYATSSDGIVWTKYAGNPVLDLGAPGEWDDYHVYTPSVLFKDGTYKMWYSGEDGSNDRIGYATSIPPTFPVGDVSGNGSVTAYDAALILQYTVGLIDHFPVEDMMSPSVSVPRDYIVRMPEQKAKAGERIYVPVAINDATGLVAGGITLKYDSTVLKAVNVLTDTSLQSAYWEANTNINGEVRFAFAATKPTKGQGNLLIVEFEVLPNTEGKTSPLIFDDVSLSDSTNIKMKNGFVTILSPNFALLQNFPNPFNPETWIPYKLASNASVTIRIHDIKGKLVRTIGLGNRTTGSYVTKDKAAYWDGTDSLGQKVVSGVYFYTFQAGEFKATRKMVILK
jgi:predicted GH43/DUF377 family glycosyl hydrolase